MLKKAVLFLSIGLLLIVGTILIIKIISATSTASVTYDFSDTTNNKAYNATKTSNWTAEEFFTAGTELPPQGYTNIQTNNNVNATCINAGNSDYCLYRFVFNLNQTPSNVQRLNITWMGGETTDDTNVRLAVYNWTSNTWTRIGTVAATKSTLTLNLSGANVANHIGSTSNNVTLSITTIGGLADGSPESVNADFVKLDVLYTNNNPTWQSNSTNGTAVGSYVQHSVNILDDVGLSGYIFSWNNGSGTYTNNSFVTLTGTDNWSNVSKWINTTEGTKISWWVWFNDSANNINSTGLASFNYTTTAAVTTCWTYDSVGKMLIIPTGCVYNLDAGGVQGI